ncbi:hypothetical protein BT69DRAFT_1344895 [Atractiella rhizophila]|nr:hypothetical protein BT69DRAFT_1344895 [Atractiella rhizophila]
MGVAGTTFSIISMVPSKPTCQIKLVDMASFWLYKTCEELRKQLSPKEEDTDCPFIAHSLDTAPILI